MKFKVGDTVRIKDSSDVRTIKHCYGDVTHSYWYALDNGYCYYESSLKMVDDVSAIQTIYRVDGLDFDTIEEAIKHEQKILLFKLLENTMEDNIDLLLPIVDAIVDNASKVKEILK